MRRAKLALAVATLLTTHGVAQAHRPALSEGIRFTLKPRPITLMRYPGPAERARISPLDPVQANDRAHELSIMVQRRKLRLLPEQDLAFASAFNPRSRVILMTVEDRAPVGDGATVSAGFQGVKLSHRGANVTAIDGGERLRTRDWFMPHAMIEIAVAPAVGLSIGYRETLRAYGDAGAAGPMGLSREAFRSFATHLRPERHARLRLDAGWKPSCSVALAITAYEGRIDERLFFADRSYLPSNSGSGGLSGIRMSLTHRPSPHWRWSMRYGEARVHEANGRRVRESSMAVEAGWTSGRWSATLQGAKNSPPALSKDVAQGTGRVRVEGEMRYHLPRFNRGAASISLRLTDPNRLASTVLLREGPAGPVGAADQARGLMLGVDLSL